MKKIFLILIFNLLFLFNSFSLNTKSDIISDEISKKITGYMKTGGIPGLSIAVIKGDSINIVKAFGYADQENKLKSTPSTLFELGSCTKAFTALAILNLEREKKLKLNDSISKYLPWFYAKYKGVRFNISIEQLLFHTSGISWNTISNIPICNSDSALELTIKKFSGSDLNNIPGEKYEYASLNYDILGLIIQKISGESFEKYMNRLITNVLDLKNTSMGRPDYNLSLAQGYKNSFFAPRRYTAPLFRGNNPAGYIITNANDMEKWLRLQLSSKDDSLSLLINKSHIRDGSVPPSSYDLTSYAMGWFVSLNGDNVIFHSGLNPNYTSYIAFNPKEQIGVAVLANSNSSYTNVIGQYLIKTISGKEYTLNYKPNDLNDKVYSFLSIFIFIYILALLVYLIYIFSSFFDKKRVSYKLTSQNKNSLVIGILFILPIIYGIYLLPKAMAGFSWEAALIWSPESFKIFIYLISTAILLSYIAYILSLKFPPANKFKKSLPIIAVLSLLSGFANMSIVLIITSAVYFNGKINYLLYYFVMTFLIYILGRKIVQTKLIRITNDLIHEIRTNIISRIFSTSYGNFEQIRDGRIMATLYNDTGTLGNSANLIVNFATSTITVIGAFIYLSSIAFWATILTMTVIILIAGIYYYVNIKTEKFYEKARDIEELLMWMIEGMQRGFKELSIHKTKRVQYKKEISDVSNLYRNNISYARIKFTNAFLVGESLLILTLAVVAFALPMIFPNVQRYILMSFIIVLLYLIGPVNGILGSIPQFVQMNIAWKRIKGFIRDIPENTVNNELGANGFDKNLNIEKFSVSNLEFSYKTEVDNFSIGPISFELKKGEILFVIGGNGSGKSTLAKLLTGLYIPDNGKIEINDIEIDNTILGEYFSAVFNPFQLFKQLFDLELNEQNTNTINDYLKLFQLSDKVHIENNEFNTIHLSQGQRKRLALLRCYLDNRHIFLLDEWAADQDPSFKKYFYYKLLKELKRQGKIIIAITHDDNYFDVADKIVKLDCGKMQQYDINNIGLKKVKDVI